MSGVGVDRGQEHGEAWDLRPMALGDVDAVIGARDAAVDEQVRQGLLPPRRPRGTAELERLRRAHARFVGRDGPGAWVAVAGDRVVGMAEALRRGDFWGLSMLFVHPGFQSRGVGHRLLDAALGYGVGARVRMIQSSADPRAVRRYALAGLPMHPAAELGGAPDRRAIPVALPGRPGDTDDLGLVASVEAHLGRSRTEDAAFVLESGEARLDVVDSGARRGWVLWEPGRLHMLGATDEETAATLLWRYLAGCDVEAVAYGLTASQGWAFAVAHAARLSVRVSHAMFIDGMAVPAPWIPSGWYF